MVGLFGLGSKDPNKKGISKKKKELRKLVKEKKYDSALRIGSQILKDNPDENDVLFIIGGIYYLKGNSNFVLWKISSDCYSWCRSFNSQCHFLF